MKIEVEHPEFQRERLTVETAGLVQSPKLLLNGVAVKGDKGRYLVRSDSGMDLPIALKGNFFDPVPKMKIGDVAIQLARSFQWYEYVWFGFLILSLYQASPVGGLIGAVGAFVSARIFRSNSSAPKKIGFAALIFVGCIGLLVLFNVMLILIGVQ